ncbi:TPA: hypothetical protein ACGGRU_005054, partial [Escherichia coli]
MYNNLGIDKANSSDLTTELAPLKTFNRRLNCRTITTPTAGSRFLMDLLNNQHNSIKHPLIPQPQPYAC